MNDEKQRYEDFKDIALRLMALSFGLSKCVDKYQDIVANELNMKKVDFNELTTRGTKQ